MTITFIDLIPRSESVHAGKMNPRGPSVVRRNAFRKEGRRRTVDHAALHNSGIVI
jgi:hypothetical protein